MRKNNNHGFALIEVLIAVIIIAILVILATPRYKEYVEAAEITHICNDTQVMRDILQAEIRQHGEDIQNGVINPERQNLILESFNEDIDDLISKNIVYDNRKRISEKGEITSDTYYLIREDFVESYNTSELKGRFITNIKGQALYINRHTNSNDQLDDLNRSNKNTGSLDAYNYKKIHIALEALPLYRNEDTESGYPLIRDGDNIIPGNSPYKEYLIEGNRYLPLFEGLGRDADFPYDSDKNKISMAFVKENTIDEYEDIFYENIDTILESTLGKTRYERFAKANRDATTLNSEMNLGSSNKQTEAYFYELNIDIEDKDTIATEFYKEFVEIVPVEYIVETGVSKEQRINYESNKKIEENGFELIVSNSSDHTLKDKDNTIIYLYGPK